MKMKSSFQLPSGGSERLQSTSKVFPFLSPQHPHFYEWICFVASTPFCISGFHFILYTLQLPQWLHSQITGGLIIFYSDLMISLVAVGAATNIIILPLTFRKSNVYHVILRFPFIYFLNLVQIILFSILTIFINYSILIIQ